MKSRAQPQSGKTLLLRRGLGLLIGGVFVYAGVVKLLDPLRFASDITNYQILPWQVSVRLAFYLPWLEVLCGGALIFQRVFAGAVFLTSLLMVLFLGATASAWARGIDVSCGCFGAVGSGLGFAWHLVLDVALLAGLIFLWFRQCRADRPTGEVIY